jgi:hypothetical protein
MRESNDKFQWPNSILSGATKTRTMAGKDKDQDIRDVVREERSRGRRPIDAELQRELRERENAIMKVIQRRDRRALEEILELYYSPAEVKEKLKLYDTILGSD